MSEKTAIVWFRQDLRLRDNPALAAAVADGYRIIPVFILDDHNSGEWKHGGASRWWLHRSLHRLKDSLAGRLLFFKGNAATIIPDIVKKTNADAIFWNRCYEPWRIERDKIIKESLVRTGRNVLSFNASLLWEPWEVVKGDGTPYKVFTPYYRKGCLGRPAPASPVAAPKNIVHATHAESGIPLEELGLLPAISWYKDMEISWQPGESGAQKRLENFLSKGLAGYKEGRNRPDFEKISRLSPHLHFGEISVREVWHAARTTGIAEGLETDMDCFCSELGWREFSHYLLYHFPKLPSEPLQPRFRHFEWGQNDEALLRWQKGMSGIPIVDAGMRQLWQTGWMHNRVRMIVASFLVKNLLLHWKHGEEWFWDCLVDADLASNSASWQWVAGCGADAAPYFRIFNPVTQGEKFDPGGDYVRTFVPELADVPIQFIHKPWEYDESPASYPSPIVDLKKSRTRALAVFEKLKSTS